METVVPPLWPLPPPAVQNVLIDGSERQSLFDQCHHFCYILSLCVTLPPMTTGAETGSWEEIRLGPTLRARFIYFVECMSVSVYVSMCLCVCVSLCRCLCASVPLCLCASVPLCLCVSVCLCVYASMRLCACAVCVCEFMRLCVCAFVRLCVCASLSLCLCVSVFL